MNLRELTRRVEDAFGENVPVDQTRRRQVFKRLYVATDSGAGVSLPPLQLADYMPDEVDEVRVGMVENLSNGAAPLTAAVSPFWRMVGPRRVLITGFAGLTASTQYRLTLVCE